MFYIYLVYIWLYFAHTLTSPTTFQPLRIPMSYLNFFIVCTSMCSRNVCVLIDDTTIVT